MSDKIRNIVVSCIFVLFIFGFAAMCVVCYFNPVDTSESERRPLAQFPENITIETVIDKTSIDEFEKYSVDQFPFREFFRSLKAKFQMNVLNLKENNGLAVEDGYISKIEQDFDGKVTDYSVGRLEYIYNKYLKDNGGNKYIAIVPDKNYFLGDYGYPTPDYISLVNKVTGKLNGMQYIDIFGSLELSDYYRTDTHWSQDKLDGVLSKLSEEMGFEVSGNYEENVASNDFKGVYFGQSALNPAPDKITYLTNSVLNDLKVYDYENNTTYGIYDFDKLGTSDEYEFFLSGTRALLRIDNPNATTNKELIIFRDSYGSSIAPLIAEGYRRVYVVDIRYINPDMIPKMINLQNKDVLFLYSALILNSRSFR